VVPTRLNIGSFTSKIQWIFWRSCP
jgi:hypothetical protein